MFGLKQLNTWNGEEVLLDQAGGFFGPCHADKLVIVIIFLIRACQHALELTLGFGNEVGLVVNELGEACGVGNGFIESADFIDQADLQGIAA